MAQKDWRWNFDEASSKLSLMFDAQVCLDLSYSETELVSDAFAEQAFTLEDAAFMQQVLELFQEQYLYDEQSSWLLAVHATAARRFYKPMMPKSWFFLPGASMSLHSPVLVELDTQEGETGTFLVFELGESASSCMLVSESLNLSDSRTMQRFEIIKVMNNRIARFLPLPQYQFSDLRSA